VIYLFNSDGTATALTLPINTSGNGVAGVAAC
jgi:hypothetical protein